MVKFVESYAVKALIGPSTAPYLVYTILDVLKKVFQPLNNTSIASYNQKHHYYHHQHSYHVSKVGGQAGTGGGGGVDDWGAGVKSLEALRGQAWVAGMQQHATHPHHTLPYVLVDVRCRLKVPEMQCGLMRCMA